jgi:hypothetical protein
MRPRRHVTGNPPRWNWPRSYKGPGRDAETEPRRAVSNGTSMTARAKREHGTSSTEVSRSWRPLPSLPLRCSAGVDDHGRLVPP